MRRKTVDMDKVLKNSDLIQPIEVEHLMEPAEDDNRIDAGTPIDYNDCTKEELITVLKSRDTVLGYYEEREKEINEKHNKELEELQKYYVARINEIKALNEYHERKLDIIKNIIVMEGEKK